MGIICGLLKMLLKELYDVQNKAIQLSGDLLCFGDLKRQLA